MLTGEILTVLMCRAVFVLMKRLQLITVFRNWYATEGDGFRYHTARPYGAIFVATFYWLKLNAKLPSAMPHPLSYLIAWLAIGTALIQNKARLKITYLT
jgi:hypothetical protein